MYTRQLPLIYVYTGAFKRFIELLHKIKTFVYYFEKIKKFNHTKVKGIWSELLCNLVVKLNIDDKHTVTK